MRSRAAAAVALLALAAAWGTLPGCRTHARREAERLTGGNVERGRAAIAREGCGACHTIAGVPGADGMVGPPLDRLANRVYIAGRLVNDPPTLTAWIRDPQHLRNPTAMPPTGVGAAEARDIAAYLYTLR